MKRAFLIALLCVPAYAQLQMGGNLQSGGNLQAGQDTTNNQLSIGMADYMVIQGPASCVPGTTLTAAIVGAGTVGTGSAPAWSESGSGGATVVCAASQATLGAVVWVNGTLYQPGLTSQSWQLPSNVTLTTMNFPVPPGNLFVGIKGYWCSGIPNDSSGDHDSFVPEATGTNSPYCTIQPFAPTGAAQAYARVEVGQTVTHSDAFTVPGPGKINITLNKCYYYQLQCDGAPTLGTVTTSNGAIGSCTANCVQWTSTTYGPLACPFNGYWTTTHGGITITSVAYTITSVQTGCIATLGSAPGTQVGAAAIGPGNVQLALFDPASNYAQVGSTIFFGMPVIQGGQGFTTILMLNNESGTSSASDNSFFEDTMVDLFYREFPDVPSTNNNVPYAIPMQIPQANSCGSSTTCAKTNVLPVKQGDLLILATTSTSTTTTFSSPTATGTGCSGTTWTFVSGSRVASNAIQTSAWYGLASGNGPCTPSLNTSPAAAMEAIFAEFKSVSGAVDTNAAAATCATCTTLTVTSSAGSSVANEIAFAWDRNTGGSFGATVPGCAQYNTSGGATVGPYLCPIPTAGTTFSWVGTWSNSATDFGAGMIMIEP